MPERMFKENLFDESVIGYGYEDLLYAFSLEKKSIKIRHIDNAVIHDGLKLLIFLFVKQKTQ
ncbi:MAG: hypothetical protein IPO92_18135 [Saprospiraceae bacterium]|nr:hypothetical protein [Saprospiraceae bacterium]